MLLGLDSTDSVDGGCTTHVALEIWSRLPHLATRGGPRLVRLNPNVPYKTRGNGALCLDLGHARGTTRLAGVMRGRELHAARSIDEPSPREQQEIFAIARNVIQRRRASSAGSALIHHEPDPDDADTYRTTVQRHTSAPAIAPSRCTTWGDGRGAIGALAAAAWPAERGTYELIAYREPGRWGTPRRLPLERGADLDRIGGTFDNWDPAHRKLRAAPNSPCPILFGVRGTDPTTLPQTLDVFPDEPIDAWALFTTNQASGDHLRPTQVADVRPFDSVELDCVVAKDPWTVAGGHVFVDLADETGHTLAAAYEPTKGFRDHVRRLRTGDRVRVEAAAHADPRLLALEALTLTEAVAEHHLDPRCKCGGRLRSAGRHAQPICNQCGRRAWPDATPWRPRPTSVRVTVPISVRRHLSRPTELAPERLAFAHGGSAA